MITGRRIAALWQIAVGIIILLFFLHKIQKTEEHVGLARKLDESNEARLADLQLTVDTLSQAVSDLSKAQERTFGNIQEKIYDLSETQEQTFAKIYKKLEEQAERLKGLQRDNAKNSEDIDHIDGTLIEHDNLDQQHFANLDTEISKFDVRLQKLSEVVEYEKVQISDVTNDQNELILNVHELEEEVDKVAKKETDFEDEEEKMKAKISLDEAKIVTLQERVGIIFQLKFLRL